MLRPRDQWPYALAALRIPDDARVCDLDRTATLRQFKIDRPTRVVALERATTQAWSRRIFEAGQYDGISWWSHYHPTYRVFGLWRTDLLTVTKPPEPLTLEHPTVVRAADALVRYRDL